MRLPRTFQVLAKTKGIVIARDELPRFRSEQAPQSRLSPVIARLLLLCHCEERSDEAISEKGEGRGKGEPGKAHLKLKIG
jgi:hypothetical protein